eukprot:RCo031276
MNSSFACQAKKLNMPRPAESFLCALWRLRAAGLPPVGALQGAQSSFGVQKKFLRMAVDARVMKARKSLELSSLRAEVVRQVSRRFAPNFRMVTTLVEDLMQREYLM